MQCIMKMHLLQDMGTIAERFFFQKVLYSGKKDVSFVSTAKKALRNQKCKISFCLIPDTYSAWRAFSCE